MIYAVIAVFFLFWLAGMLSALTAGGLVHILLVVAVVMLLLQVFNGRRAL